MADNTPDTDATVRAMLATIAQLTKIVVEQTAIIRWIYRNGDSDEITRAIKLRPKALHGWKLRADKALAQAAHYVPIPEAPQISEKDLREERLDYSYGDDL